MNFNELTEKYRALQDENRKLKEKIKLLENQIGEKLGATKEEVENDKNDQDQIIKPDIPLVAIKSTTISKQSSPTEKIDLYKLLFKGREDVFATRWENSKKGTSGYSPACDNEWVPGICQKPKIKCSACKNKDFLKFDSQSIEDHLRGKNSYWNLPPAFRRNLLVFSYRL
jgi:hypothetical protein